MNGRVERFLRKERKEEDGWMRMRGRTEADCMGTKLRPVGDRLGEIGASIVQVWLA